MHCGRLWKTLALGSKRFQRFSWQNHLGGNVQNHNLYSKAMLQFI